MRSLPTASRAARRHPVIRCTVLWRRSSTPTRSDVPRSPDATRSQRWERRVPLIFPNCARSWTSRQWTRSRCATSSQRRSSPDGSICLPRIAAVGLALLLTSVVPGCTAKEAPSTPDVATWRAEKDRYFRESPESPVPEEGRAACQPLPYYPIDPVYQVPAALTVAPGAEVLELPTSTGLRRKMRKIGALQFTLKGQTLALTAFVDASTNDVRSLFVPFGDMTNGNETYPGGRYLDLERTATGIYDIDFNRAYHPFCVFNPAYDCPYPPRENRLALPIRAGERLRSTK